MPLGGYMLGGGFAVGTLFGAWVYAGQIAKRDLKQQRLTHEQEVSDLRGMKSAVELELDNLKLSIEESAGDNLGTATVYVTDNRTLRKEIESLRDQLKTEKKKYYDTPIPDTSIDRINCAFRSSLCGNPGAGTDKTYRSRESGENKYPAYIDGAPRRGADGAYTTLRGYYPQ